MYEENPGSGEDEEYGPYDIDTYFIYYEDKPVAIWFDGVGDLTKLDAETSFPTNDPRYPTIMAYINTYIETYQKVPEYWQDARS